MHRIKRLINNTFQISIQPFQYSNYIYTVTLPTIFEKTYFIIKKQTKASLLLGNRSNIRIFLYKLELDNYDRNIFYNHTRTPRSSFSWSGNNDILQQEEKISEHTYRQKQSDERKRYQLCRHDRPEGKRELQTDRNQ